VLKWRSPLPIKGEWKMRDEGFKGMLNRNGPSLIRLVGNSGFGLLEVIVAVGIFGILTSVMMTLSVNQLKAAKNTDKLHAKSNTTENIRAVLGRAKACMATMGGKDPRVDGFELTEIRDEMGKPTFKVGDSYEDGNIRLTKMRVDRYVASSTQSTLTLSFEKVKETDGAQSLHSTFRLATTLDSAFRIIECSSLSEMSDGIWTRITGTSPWQIYFNEGAVGIGTAVPEAQLHVQARPGANTAKFVAKNAQMSMSLIGDPTSAVDSNTAIYMGAVNPSAQTWFMATKNGNIDPYMSNTLTFGTWNGTAKYSQTFYPTGQVAFGLQNNSKPWGNMAVNNDRGQSSILISGANIPGDDTTAAVYLARNTEKNGALSGYAPWFFAYKNKNLGGFDGLAIGKWAGTNPRYWQTIRDSGQIAFGEGVADPNYPVQFFNTTTGPIKINGGLITDGNTQFSSDLTIGKNLGVNGSVAVAGVVSASLVTASSDARLKTSIHRFSGALEKIRALKGVRYHLLREGDGGKEYIGLIAQEVEKVLPEFVEKDAKGMYSVNYAQMVTVAVEAIKEADQANAKRDEEINFLKREIEELKRRK
jgi:prepilin-type N-terminal cleavage/methylation domain-containing protein